MGHTAAELFDRHVLAVFRYLRRTTGDTDLAEELTQEVFLRVVRGLHTYRVRGREESWVLRIAYSVLRDHINRTEGTPVQVVSLDDLPYEPWEEPSQIVAIGFSEAIALLPEAERETFLLRELGGLTYEELAAACETTEEAVRSRLYRARGRIRGLLAGRLAPADLKQREGE